MYKPPELKLHHLMCVTCQVHMYLTYLKTHLFMLTVFEGDAWHLYCTSSIMLRTSRTSRTVPLLLYTAVKNCWIGHQRPQLSPRMWQTSGKSFLTRYDLQGLTTQYKGKDFYLVVSSTKFDTNETIFDYTPPLTTTRVWYTAYILWDIS